MTSAVRAAPWAVVWLLLAVATGCADRAPSQFAGLAPAKARALAMAEARVREQTLEADLASAFAEHPPVNVLVISGGDAHGAFACGVLAGWRRSRANPRPTFDIVTGVSTGALMATFVFLGEPGDDATLRDLYLHVRDKDIFGPPMSGLPDGVLDTSPLRKLIAKHVTPDVVRRIAAAHRQGRRLYVATVDLDSGDLFIWPMSRLADEAVAANGKVDAGRLQQFRDILLASASIPVVFPPVELEGGLHVDAGLATALFLKESMLGFTTAAHASAAKRVPPPAPTVWVIFCGQLRAPPKAVDATLSAIGVRSLELYNHAVELLSLREAAFLAEAHNPPFAFRWIAEPPSNAPPPPAPGLLTPMFDPAAMAKLYDTGQSLAAGDHAWQAGPPAMVEVQDAEAEGPAR